MENDKKTESITDEIMEQALEDACNEVFGIDKSFEEKVDEAIRNSDNYTLEELGGLWNLCQFKKKQEKIERHNDKLRAKIIKNIKRDFDKTYIPNWKISLWILEKKIKEKSYNLKEKIRKK
ncbi:MAG: hypothetical protein ACFFG0_22605 [Candidatus Thorarchaeota archaeon]